MTRSNLPILDELPRPVHRAMRRLRWFSVALREQARQAEAESGLRFCVEERKLTSAFLDWLRAFEAQKPDHFNDRRAYVGFAAGLMLRSLLKHEPLAVVGHPKTAADEPVLFWPEGFVYVSFCLNVRSFVLKQDFQQDQEIAPVLSQMRTWWSFKENVAEDLSLSIAFLDLFAGDKPNWGVPGLFKAPDRPLLGPASA